MFIEFVGFIELCENYSPQNKKVGVMCQGMADILSNQIF